MTDLGGEKKKTVVKNREGIEDISATGTSARSSSSDNKKKLRFSKLWVCTRNSNATNPKVTKRKSSLKKSPSNVLARLDNIETIKKASTEEKFSQTYFNCKLTNNVSTSTCGVVTVDAGILCCCETLSTASGPDAFVEIRCVKPSSSLAVQTDDAIRVLSSVAERAKLKRDKLRGSLNWDETSSARAEEEFLEESENIDADLIYDGMKRCFPYPLELTGKPKYVATCESCEFSTDKWVSISHGGLDAAVGSSIIIDVAQESDNGKRESLDDSYQKSVSCEVCNDCNELGKKTRLRGHEFERETARFIREQCSSCLKHERNRERKKKSTSFSEESAKSLNATDEDFMDFDSTVASDNYGERNYRSESGEKSSAHRHRRSSSGERRSGRSRIDNAEHRRRDESSMFLNDSISSWPYDLQERESTREALRESPRLSLKSIENSGRSSRALGYRENEPADETKLFETLTRSKKPLGFSGHEINARSEDFDGVILRKRKTRTADALKTRERKDIFGIERCQFIDKNGTFLGCKREGPFTFTLQKFTKPSPGMNQIRNLLSGTCKISDFNNFGKRYDWDRPPIDSMGRQKSCKCGNGCGGLNSRNKCCCYE